MYPQIYDIALKFGIRPQNITRLKYLYIIHSDEGIYSLCRARPCADRIELLHGIKEGLAQRGFDRTDRYITAEDGGAYTVYEDEVYTMTRFHGMNELDFLNNDMCLRAVSAIAAMHRAAESVCADRAPIQRYENGLAHLSKAKKASGLKKYPSDTDLLFRRTCGICLNSAQRAVDMLQRLNFDGSRIIYAHNSLKEDNLIYSRGRVYIIDWDNADKGSPIADLAFFVRRYIRKNAYYAHRAGRKYLSLYDILAAYNNENRLNKRETDILHALLMYPTRYIAAADEFYQKQRTFTPASIQRKAEEITEQWDFTANYCR